MSRFVDAATARMTVLSRSVRHALEEDPRTDGDDVVVEPWSPGDRRARGEHLATDQIVTHVEHEVVVQGSTQLEPVVGGELLARRVVGQ